MAVVLMPLFAAALVVRRRYFIVAPRPFPAAPLVVRRYEATENELKGSGMTISKKSIRVLKVTDFEIIVCLPTSTF
jgi:hypothetical protein